MSDEDFAAAGRGGAKASGGPGKHRGPRFTWNPQYEATFFRSLCESVSLGLRDGSTFKPEAWERAMQALIDKHNAYANKGHLINKTDNARKKYRLWRGLREDPEFFYNPQTRTVTATDDAWARHLQKEPLARSLRSRPFEHEEYYEILFPDVIGSGGAPKRLMKPRRKGTDSSINGAEDHDAPGTAIMDLLTDTAYINPSQTHLPPPIPQTTMPPPLPTHAPPPPQHHQHPHAPANTMPPPPPPPPRSSVSSTSALTPPEETALQTRKRSHAPDGGVSSNGTGQQPPDKRRRTAPPGYLDLTLPSQPQPQQQQQLHQPPPQPPQAANGPTSSSSTAITTSASSSTPPALTTLPLTLTEGILLLADALRSGTTTTTTSSSRGGGGLGLGGGGGGSKAAAHLLRPAPVPGWQEQAMDIFFRDFAGEDMDLQLKIAEKVLADENKAMVFCKMPDALRRHWVKRLREMHNRVV